MVNGGRRGGPPRIVKLAPRFNSCHGNVKVSWNVVPSNSADAAGVGGSGELFCKCALEQRKDGRVFTGSVLANATRTFRTPPQMLPQTTPVEVLPGGGVTRAPRGGGRRRFLNAPPCWQPCHSLWRTQKHAASGANSGLSVLIDGATGKSRPPAEPSRQALRTVTNERGLF